MEEEGFVGALSPTRDLWYMLASHGSLPGLYSVQVRNFVFFFKIVFEIILWSQLIWKSLGISHSSVWWTNIIIRKNSQLIGFADRKPIGNVCYMLLNPGPLFVNWRREESGEAGRTVFWSSRLAPVSAESSFSFSTLGGLKGELSRLFISLA